MPLITATAVGATVAVGTTISMAMGFLLEQHWKYKIAQFAINKRRVISPVIPTNNNASKEILVRNITSKVEVNIIIDMMSTINMRTCKQLGLPESISCNSIHNLLQVILF